jgi:class 3 adenylate cyclase
MTQPAHESESIGNMTNSKAEPEFAEKSAETQRTKKAFLTYMRHECRTPVNAIIGYSELLLEQAQDQECKSLAADLQRIQESGKELLNVINVILDSSRIEAQTDINIEEFSAKMRHALRTPINSVIGYVDMVVEGIADGHQENLSRDLKRIRTAAENLLGLINDIVVLWQNQADKMDLEIKHFSLFDMIRNTMTTFRPLTEHSAVGTKTGSLLIVDDNETNRDLLSRQLEQQGHTVLVANNGKQALNVIREESFDLVLLDIVMPEMNGFQVLEQLKADESLRHIPVIMISSLDEIESVVRCIEMGADDYLQKPFNPVLLRARINACLEKKRLHDQERTHMEQLRIERGKSERLLLNVLPEPIADRLKQGENPIADSFKEVTVLFADLVSFTKLSTYLPPVELVESLNELFSMFDRLAERYGLEKIKTMGDAYMAVAGLPIPRSDNVEAAANMALHMLEGIERVRPKTGKPFRMRIGMHTGPVIAGVIGTKKFTYDLWGDTVNTASRLESNGVPGGILVLEETYLRLRECYSFRRHERIDLKGKGEKMTYVLTGAIVP